MTVALVLLLVEVLAPAARRLLEKWRTRRNQRSIKHWRGRGHPPRRD